MTARRKASQTATQNVSRVLEKAQPARCRGCGSTIGIGLDGEVAALVARVDLEHLDPTGIAWVLASGRGLYELRGTPGHRYLNPIRPWRVLRRGFQFDHPVLAEHRCSVRPHAALLDGGDHAP